MGWYLRKSFGLGPFRLNLSKSGIGYSVGVRGARIGVGPRGNYVRLGRGGVYYQKYFSTPSSQPGDGAHSFVPAEVPELGTRVVSADAALLHDATSEGLLREIQAKQRKTRLAPVGAILSCLLVVAMLVVKVPLWLTLAAIPLLVCIHVYLAHTDYESKLVVLNYELDSDARTRYVDLLNALQSLATSARLWRVTSQLDFVDRKYSAGADRSINRKPIFVRQAAPAHVQTQTAVWSLGLGDQTLYFFPDRILVYQGSEVGAVSYAGLSLELRQTRFVEEGDVPSDAQIVDHTWQYVNKNGGPDRRFSNNRQLPLVLYAYMTIRSGTGLNMLLQSSDLNKATAFKAGLDRYIGSSARS
ncbi:MAG TPA: DUF4236 domain-containing protein [Pyrinomonadaceae bacterium]|jgi:hypothetical protein